MDTTDRLWLEAQASAQTGIDADTREEAYEVFVAEAARCRLVDRRGSVSLRMRSGTVIRGRQAEGDVEGHLHLEMDDATVVQVCAEQVVVIGGGAACLRREDASWRTLTSCLRDAWSDTCTIRVLATDGVWRHGEIDFVGADHVTLRADGTLVTVAFQAAEAWQLG